jgi:hypothetical protein
MNPLTLIPSAYMLYVRIAAVVLVAALCFGTGWKVNGWRLGTVAAGLQVQEAHERADALAAALRAAKVNRERAEALQAQLAGISATGYAALRKGEHENDNLRNAVATGASVVRVHGLNCPGTADVPPAVAGRGVDSGGGAALDVGTGQTFLSVRAVAGRISAKLETCQRTLGCITGQTACPAQ